MTFVPLAYEHLDQMVEIEKEAFEHENPWSKNMFIPELSHPYAHYIVGVSGDEVISYAGYHTVVDEAHITNVAVKNTYRGKGFGKLTLSRLIYDAQIVGLKRMTLEVRVDNIPAIKLYESYGFVSYGVRKKYYDGKYDALIMWKELQEENKSN